MQLIDVVAISGCLIELFKDFLKLLNCIRFRQFLIELSHFYHVLFELFFDLANVVCKSQLSLFFMAVFETCLETHNYQVSNQDQILNQFLFRKWPLIQILLEVIKLT